ncbi:MAG: CvpA family protein [Patescibacteria group bacterium]
MQLVDLILIIIIGGFGLFGLWFGFVHTLGSLLGTVIGAVVATRYYEPVADFIIGFTGWENTNLVRVIVFIIAFLIINRLVGFLFWIADRVLSLVTRLPFINSIDRLLGLVFGLIEGALTLGLIIFFIERFPLSVFVMEHLALSTVAPYLSNLAALLWPFLPEAFRLLDSSIDYVENRFFP